MVAMKSYLYFAAAMIVMSATASLLGDNWGQWRGPSQSGVAPGSNYPTEWGEEKNVVWKVELPGWGTSTPAVWEEWIFLTSTGDENNNLLICLNRDGQKQWQVAIGTSAGNLNRKASGANPSAVTDGKHVYAYYRSGDLAAVDFAGKIVWSTNLQERYGPDQHQWDLGTSPVLTDDSVVIAVMHQGASYVVAVDKATGQERWKRSRDLGAPAESRDSYTTPLLVEESGRPTIVVLGADHVTAHDAGTGDEVWRFGHLNPEGRRNWRQIASPVASGELIVVPYGRGNTLTAIRRGGSGDVSTSHKAWVGDSSGDVPSPIFHEGRIYFCSDRGDKVKCVRSADGKEMWTLKLPTNRYQISASPVLADGHLYITREDGTTFVVAIGDTPELIATNVLRENTYASPVFVDGRIFLRTSNLLFCLGRN